MRIHHSKHHNGYVNNLNAAVKKLGEAEAAGDLTAINQRMFSRKLKILAILGIFYSKIGSYLFDYWTIKINSLFQLPEQSTSMVAVT